MIRATTALLLTSLVFACDSGAPAADQAAKQEADNKAAEAAAAQAKAKEDAKRAQDAQKLEDEANERAYEAAKGALEPLAKLPKKHPKGFAAACVAMLAEYEAFLSKSLDADALAAWNGGGSVDRLRVMRRECHLREVNVVVCETEVLKAAPVDAELGHIMRICEEKFAG